jgi:hypothetical protein
MKKLVLALYLLLTLVGSSFADHERTQGNREAQLDSNTAIYINGERVRGLPSEYKTTRWQLAITLLNVDVDGIVQELHFDTQVKE